MKKKIDIHFFNNEDDTLLIRWNLKDGLRTWSKSGAERNSGEAGDDGLVVSKVKDTKWMNGPRK